MRGTYAGMIGREDNPGHFRRIYPWGYHKMYCYRWSHFSLMSVDVSAAFLICSILQCQPYSLSFIN